MFVYATSKNAIRGNASYTVTATVFFIEGDVPVIVVREPVPKRSRTRSCFCFCREKSVTSSPDMRMNSEGAKSPTTRSCPPSEATTRLCIVSSNSTRMFLPSTRAGSAAKPGAHINTSNTI